MVPIARYWKFSLKSDHYLAMPAPHMDINLQRYFLRLATIGAISLDLQKTADLLTCSYSISPVVRWTSPLSLAHASKPTQLYELHAVTVRTFRLLW